MPAPKAEKPKRTRKAKQYTVAEVAKAIAKRKGTDPTVEAKKLRGYIRGNFDALQKEWPSLKSSGKNNRDGNRYAPMPEKLANKLIKARTTK